MRSFSRSGAGAVSAMERGACACACAAVLACCALPGLVTKAHACGGFWCSQQAPVNQAAERILFVDHPDGTVSALIEIQYSGPSERFAWLIPIPGDPDIAIASSTAIARLDEATAPEYRLERTVAGTCADDPEQGHFADGGVSFDVDSGSAAEPVMVVDSGTVGPYDYATIAVAPNLDDPASAALTWFGDNGFDFSKLDGDLLRPYLQEGLHLLAFKLTKAAQRQVGAIRPVIIHYTGELPMIPIRPTAVAAVPDMGVQVWIAGESRAVPSNYKSLVLDEALIDWFYFRDNYDAVVTHAADEAGGQGFVTELAGASAGVATSIYPASDAEQLSELESASYPEGLDALWGANRLYNGWDGWREAVAAAVTLPDGVTLDAFALNPEAYRASAQVSTEALFAALHEKVVDPVVAVQRLLAARPYLTRLYTTMSPAEMTMDPLFTFNADLPDVSNVHVAKQVIACSGWLSENEAPWRIVLPQGDVVSGRGRAWPLAIDALPANLRIEQLPEHGQGRVLEDNSAAISAALRKADGSAATAGSAARGDAGRAGGGKFSGPVFEARPASRSSSDDDGCAVTTAGASGRGHRPLLALALLALLACLRRRRAPRALSAPPPAASPWPPRASCP